MINVDNRIAGIAGTQFKNWRDVCDTRPKKGVSAKALSSEQVQECAERLEALRLTGKYKKKYPATLSVANEMGTTHPTVLRCWKKVYDKEWG